MWNIASMEDSVNCSVCSWPLALIVSGRSPEIGPERCIMNTSCTNQS